MTIMNVRFYKGLAVSGRSNEFAAGVYPTSAGEDVDGVAIGAMLFVSKGDEHVAFEVGKLS